MRHSQPAGKRCTRSGTLLSCAQSCVRALESDRAAWALCLLTSCIVLQSATVAGERESGMVVTQLQIKSVHCTPHGADILSMDNDAGGKQYYCAVPGAIAHLANKLATNTAVQKWSMWAPLVHEHTQNDEWSCRTASPELCSSVDNLVPLFQDTVGTMDTVQYQCRCREGF